MLEVLLNSFIVALSLLTASFFVIPYLFLHWKTFKNRFLFSGVINYPSKKDKFLHEPEKFGLTDTTNHTLTVERGRVNLWLIKPTSSPSSQIIVLYCHGASSNRGKEHRVEFYQVVQQLGFTVVTFDYRGFGDSKGTRANDTSVIHDCRAVLDWITSEFPSHRIVVWGHSLGSGISTKFISEHGCTEEGPIRGLILESGFTSAADAAANFPAARYWNYFRVTRNRIPRSLEGIFPTAELLPNLPLPVQLIHAVDDKTIRHQHSVILREKCVAQGKHDVELHSAQTGEHKFIHRNSEAIECAKHFIERVCQ